MEGSPQPVPGPQDDDGASAGADSAPLGLLPDQRLIKVSYAVVFAASVIAYLLAKAPDIAIEVDEGFSVFAVLYIVTQAIERALEPIAATRLLRAAECENAKAVAKKKADVLGAKLSAATPTTTEADVNQAAADKQEADLKLEQLQADRKIKLWAAASVAGLAAALMLNLGLIEMVADVSKSGAAAGWFERLDVVFTGLAIGAGTKPLHDLISNLEAKKAATDPATTPSTS